MNAHAALGASNSGIWLQCSEAGRAMRTVKQSSKPSKYAAQGTVAHGLAEIAAVFGMDEIQKRVGTTETLDGFDIEIDQAMIDALQTYVSVLDKLTLPTDTRYIEERVSLDFIYENQPVQEHLFGTADAVIVSADGTEVNIVDLKFGAGVPVEADSTQTAYYGAGAVYRFAPNARIVTCTIVQPRAFHEDGPVRSKVYTRLDIENFLDRVRKSVKEIVSGGGGYVSGKWCRWCPLAGQCPELHKQNMSVARGEFMATPPEKILPTPGLLTGDELSFVLSKKDDIKRWLDNVEQEAIRRLSANDTVRDWKLVAKRARKAWSEEYSEEYHWQLWNVIGDTAHDLWVTDHLSPAKAKDILPGADYDALVVSGFITSNSSGVTLAPASDRRPAVNVADAARQDFEALEFDGDTNG